ncbi:unnamed protein product [Rotaria sp. Silwood2]|nr:unnamed protein product [Rotaria sp. Silwood2]CAF2996259.1 unnamed protein product [Rotaria sp. Silwood2]CAF3368069.1 unnamed protein product [Rotaria sp. Silwood2]CAF4132073.1 unnamed protein product [Rotaria sp. Silwood2]CAF4182052.1 unnamed protein product [Rotaria sp. Silwood2]
MPPNPSQLQQHIVTSNQSYPPTTDTTHHQPHQPNQQQSQNIVMPMDGEFENNFTLVKRKQKRSKIDHTHNDSPSSCSTTSTASTNSSTSSTNTSSIDTNIYPTNSDRPQTKSIKTSRPQTDTNNKNVPNTRYNTNEISQEARRYAETRYPFPPFVIKFQQDVDEKSTIKNIMNYFTATYNAKIVLAGHRLKNKRELLLFVENRESFSFFFDDCNWPTTIDSLVYEKTRPNHLPPQFSVILRNVPTEKDINLLLDYIKNDYPNVINAFRLSNKNQLPSTIVRLDITSVKTIDELLNKKSIYINNVRLPVTEYLAPAKVLICSKCFQIGHFRSTCKSLIEFCKVCGRGVDDIKQHKNVCSGKRCCLRCTGDHDSNDYRCPDIKTYRAILTKSLLTSAGPVNHHHNNSTNYWFNDQDFPILNGNRGNYPRSNEALVSTGKRIDDLFNKLNKLEKNFDRLLELNNNSLDQLARTQQMLLKHDHELNIQKHDITFQREFVSQFVSPICQVLVDVIPTLVKQNVINDKTLLCPSLTAWSEKLANELPVWTNRFLQNENIKAKLINDFNMLNQNPHTDSTNSNLHLPSPS